MIEILNKYFYKVLVYFVFVEKEKLYEEEIYLFNFYSELKFQLYTHTHAHTIYIYKTYSCRHKKFIFNDNNY